jgi:trimethylamine-N-oxide reductase (cytochrome c)
MTDDEWNRQGDEKSRVTDLISWEEFEEKQYVVLPLDPAWKEQKTARAGFYEDPDNNPLQTPTGKLEFYSDRLAENFPDDEERGPYAKWVVGGPGGSGLGCDWTGPSHDESLWGERCKTYPLLLITNHGRWKLHAQMDDAHWLREIPTSKVKGPDGYLYEPVWINPVDAEPRGIESGDIVKIYNERGIVLGGAYVCERIIPGAVYQDHGARIDEIIPGEVDRGGNNNAISPTMGVSKNCWGMATSGFLVECDKVTGDQMEEWRKQYPEAFTRPYDPASGLRFEAWVEGGM